MRVLAPAVSVVALALGCRKEPPPPPPPPEVEVVVVEQQSIANVLELPGRVQAIRTAEVRARVDGIVERRVYEEGTDVREGQPLFQIDPRELRAELEAAQASLVRSKATAANAAQDVERYQGLIADQAISKQEYDAAVARLRTAEADVARARAEVESARLNLSYATVRAPIAGRAGRAQVTEGALVSAAAGTLMTTIEQLDPIYVNFSQSSSELLAIRRDIAAGRLDVPRRVEVRLTLEDGTPYGAVGYINFYAMAIDVETGTVASRAQFPNPDWLLLPGQFVRAYIRAGVRHHGIIVPQRAVTLTAQGGTVMIVNQDGRVEVRDVELGDLAGAGWVVREGLEPGDRVIVSGLQRIRPGMEVRTVPPSDPKVAG